MSDIELTDSSFTNRLRVEDTSQNILHSCCGGVSDKRLITILAQVVFSGIVLIFSGLMMALKDEDNPIYMSLITSVLSYWLGKNESLK